jgi:hypothetical protein
MIFLPGQLILNAHGRARGERLAGRRSRARRRLLDHAFVMRVGRWSCVALFLWLSASAAAAQCPSPQATGARRLPAVFDAGRVLLAPTDARGDTTIFVLDSGGGFNAVAAGTVQSRGIRTVLRGTPPDTMRVAPVGAFGDSLELPVPRAGRPAHGYLAVTPELARMRPMYRAPVSGFLGSGWWADRVWSIDYLRHRLWLFSGSVLGRAPAQPSAHVVPLHFRVGPDGRRTTDFPRIRAEIDGDTLDLLFDTGATTFFSDSAMAIVADGAPQGRAGSFVPSDVFDRWQAHHPEWRVIERGEYGRRALIEVPSMNIAGYTVGPVWWERRDSAAFHKLMDPLMDRPIQGSLGGAAFRYFAITVDYPAAMACFAR